jgi:hypothetical protein
MKLTEQGTSPCSRKLKNNIIRNILLSKNTDKMMRELGGG